MTYFSDRFQKTLYFTHHAIGRMKKRNIDFNLVLELIETGEIQYKENTQHAWIFKHYEQREDNLICAAIVMGDTIIIKTVMINWQFTGENSCK